MPFTLLFEAIKWVVILNMTHVRYPLTTANVAMPQQSTISSLVSYSPYVGITNQGQDYVPVQLNPDVNTV